MGIEQSSGANNDCPDFNLENARLARQSYQRNTRETPQGTTVVGLEILTDWPDKEGIERQVVARRVIKEANDRMLRMEEEWRLRVESPASAAASTTTVGEATAPKS